MQKTDAMTRIVKARTSIILDNPFFGSLIMRMPVIEDSTCKSLWTDGVSLGFSPAYIETLDQELLKSALCHEILHCAMAHTTRCQGRNPQKFNQAADYCVNNALKAAKMPIGDGWLHDGDDLSAEARYAKMPDPPPDDGKGPGQGNGTGNQGPPDIGPGEVRPYPGPAGDGKPTEAEMSQQEQDWKVAVAQAAKAAKACGKLPAGLERLVEDILEPKVDWRSALHQFVAMQQRNDYSWAKPNRRYAHLGFILPSLYNVELPPIVVAIDTSGSIGESDLIQFASEMEAILDQYNTELEVIYCDTKVQHTERFSRDDRPIKLHAKGGGGTRFSPVFEHIDKEQIEPTCLIYLSDMEVSDWGKEPAYPVLFVQHEGRKRTPPFGEHIMMADY